MAVAVVHLPMLFLSFPRLLLIRSGLDLHASIYAATTKYARRNRYGGTSSGPASVTFSGY